MSLTLQATLIGKASTSSEHGHVQVTLNVAGQLLYLKLLPELAAMFPDLVRTIPHASERKAQQLQYLPAPSYTVTIAQVVPEVPVEAHPLTKALVNAQAAVAEVPRPSNIPVKNRQELMEQAEALIQEGLPENAGKLGVEGQTSPVYPAVPEAQSNAS